MTLRITWHNLAPSPAIEDTIHKHYQKLLQLSHAPTSARISIDRPNPSQGDHSPYKVKLELHLPGEPIVVSHTPTETAHDLYAQLNHTFDAARRQLQDAIQIRRGKVKHHEQERVNNTDDSPSFSDDLNSASVID